MELQDVEVLAEGLGFPEGPVALADGSVLLVEIATGRLTKVAPDRSKEVIAELPGGPNGAAIGPDGAVYVCNNGGISRDRRATAGIQRVDLATGEYEMLYTEAAGKPIGACNDLVFDRTGNLWATDFGAGRIYYAAPDGTMIAEKESRLESPNGIGLSPDESLLYYATTHTRQLFRRHLTAPGELVPSAGVTTMSIMKSGGIDRESVLASVGGIQEFDSLAVEADGRVCVATLLDSGITVVSPDGSIEKYTLPEKVADGAVTNICFGGADMRTAYITLSITGRLISCRWPRPGLELNFQNRA